MKYFMMIFFLYILLSCSKKDSLTYPKPDPVKPEQTKFEENGFTLQWKSSVANFSPEIKKNLIETFFKVYPKIVAEYNSNAAKEVTFELVPVAKIGDNEYPAYTSGNTITFNGNYMVKNATDWDIVTHEAVHVMQNGAQYVGWLTEGLADYIRYQFGVHNVTNWKNAFLSEKASDYKGGYGKTGRFLLWIEKNVKPGIVKGLDGALRSGKYNEEITWKELTNKTLNQLAEMYVASPSL